MSPPPFALLGLRPGTQPVAHGRVWRVETASWVCWVTPMGSRGLAQATAALAACRAPLLGVVRLPELLTHVEGWAVWSDVSGGPLHDVEALGRAVRALHDVPVSDGDPMPLADALAVRAHAVDPAWEHPFHAGLFDDAQRRWCHRDLHPRNAVAGDIVGVIDWEHARLDHPLQDLVKMACRTDFGTFLSGYGALTSRQLEQLRALLALHGRATLAWAARHADLTHVDEGRTALRLANACGDFVEPR